MNLFSKLVILGLNQNSFPPIIFHEKNAKWITLRNINLTYSFYFPNALSDSKQATQLRNSTWNMSQHSNKRLIKISNRALATMRKIVRINLIFGTKVNSKRREKNDRTILSPRNCAVGVVKYFPPLYPYQMCKKLLFLCARFIVFCVIRPNSDANDYWWWKDGIFYSHSFYFILYSIWNERKVKKI